MVNRAEEGFGCTQTQILAAAEILWRAGIILPNAEPTAVMVAVATMLRAAYAVRPHTQAQADDIDPALVKKIILVK